MKRSRFRLAQWMRSLEIRKDTEEEGINKRKREKQKQHEGARKGNKEPTLKKTTSPLVSHGAT